MAGVWEFSKLGDNLEELEVTRFFSGFLDKAHLSIRTLIRVITLPEAWVERLVRFMKSCSKPQKMEHSLRILGDWLQFDGFSRKTRAAAEEALRFQEILPKAE